MDPTSVYEALLLGIHAFYEYQVTLQRFIRARVGLARVGVQTPGPAGAVASIPQGGAVDDPGGDLDTPRRPVRARRRRRRRFWVKPWVSSDRRLQFGAFDNLLEELRLDDSQAFVNFIRLPMEIFDELLHRVTPLIEKQVTNYRRPISPGLRLATTLRHMASGDKYPSLLYNFRVSKASLCNIVPEVCQAIVTVLADEVIAAPTTPEAWRSIADDFHQKWNVPHACGALDGKHVRIHKPANSGSTYFNYKGYFSIVLMALVDAQYRFIWVDTGGDGSMSDAQIYNSSELCELLNSGGLGLPPPEPLPNTHDVDMPYFLLADDAFALRPFLMKPYATRFMDHDTRIANYRISRGRRVVENAFGILAQRNQLPQTTILQKPDNVRIIINAMVCLHNLLRIKFPTMNLTMVDRDDDNVPGAGSVERGAEVLDGLQPRPGNFNHKDAKAQRDYLKDYFNSPAGSVEWQDRMV